MHITNSVCWVGRLRVRLILDEHMFANTVWMIVIFKVASQSWTLPILGRYPPCLLFEAQKEKVTSLGSWRQWCGGFLRSTWVWLVAWQHHQGQVASGEVNFCHVDGVPVIPCWRDLEMLFSQTEFNWGLKVTQGPLISQGNYQVKWKTKSH
jgi:hypothetical protein